LLVPNTGLLLTERSFCKFFKVEDKQQKLEKEAEKEKQSI
jgi:hypothetical protein